MFHSNEIQKPIQAYLSGFRPPGASRILPFGVLNSTRFQRLSERLLDVKNRNVFVTLSNLFAD
jgi:hypothetical protein